MFCPNTFKLINERDNKTNFFIIRLKHKYTITYFARMLTKSDKFIFILIFGLLLFLNFNRHAKHGSFNYHSELWADKAGYQVFLPALFYYDFKASEFPEDIARQTGTGFSLDDKSNKVLTKYPIGVAIMQLPFFTIGAGVDAIIHSKEPRGYSKVQHKMIGVSTIFYAVLGLLFLFKSLPQHSRKTRYLLLFLTVFASNLFFYITRDAGLSHGYSFFLFALLLYTLNQFVAQPKQYAFLVVSICCIVFGSLVRPINILFYGLASAIVLVPNFKTFIEHKKEVLIGFGVAIPFVLLLVIPQLLYYNYAFGDYLAYSYNDERFLYFGNPRIARVWFAPANGLLLYSPVFILFAVGIVMRFRKYRLQSSLTLLLFFAITYLYASWWTPGLGCGYGHRGFIEFLPFFAIPMAHVLGKLKTNAITMFMTMIALLYIILLVYFQYHYDGCWYGNGYWDWQELLLILGIN